MFIFETVFTLAHLKKSLSMGTVCQDSCLFEHYKLGSSNIILHLDQNVWT